MPFGSASMLGAISQMDCLGSIERNHRAEIRVADRVSPSTDECDRTFDIYPIVAYL